MDNYQHVSRVVDLTHPEKNVIYNMTHEEAVEIVKSGDCKKIREIDGQFALVSVDGKSVHGQVYRPSNSLFHCET